MRSARRRQLKQRKANKEFLDKLILPVLLVIFAAIAVLFFVFSPHFWNGKDKLAVTVKRSNGDVSVVVLDPNLGEVNTLTVPGNTEVNVAENLGVLTIKNVWQLGIDQKIGGKLISETVTKNFLFPSFFWSDTPGEAVINPSIPRLVSFIFSNDSNLGLADKISVSWFSLNAKAINRSEVNLGISQFLKKGKLSDGSSGYILSGDVSERLTANFSDYGFTSRTVRIFIKDETGVYGLSNTFGQIMEVLGGKVVSIDKSSGTDIDCQVSGGDKSLVAKVSRLFSCKSVISGDTSELDITLGSKFAKRF